ncbi:MAG: hypothetical protein PF437_09450 [Sulfurimonas sp.]|jgi:hypothetical protein|nr:hypothetical protein [Sulfurimonas sp.]
MKRLIKIAIASLLISTTLSAMDSCYEKVCCGKTAGDAKILASVLADSFSGYELVGSGVCDVLGLSSMFGNTLEGALYKNKKKQDTIQIALNLNDTQGGILRTTKKNLDAGYSVGMVESIEDYSDNGSFGKIKVIEGKLMPMRQQTMELIINSKTTLTLTRISRTGREMPLDYVVTTGGGLDLMALKNKLGGENENESESSDDEVHISESGGSSNNDANVDTAINLLKSFF